MSKLGSILLAFVVVILVNRFFGAPMALIALVVFVAGIYLTRNPGAKWATLRGLSFVGMLFGGAWTVIGFLGGGALVGLALALMVYGCYLLNRHAAKKMSQLPD